MQLIDTHCHLDFPAFSSDRDRLLSKIRALGIVALVIPGVEAATWPSLLNLCKDRNELFPALGLHPLFVGKHQPSDLDLLDQHLSTGRAIAIGEIGLDHAPQDTDRSAQRWYFEQQLVRARHAALPVLLHVRKAHDTVLQCLKAAKVRGGIAHAFNGSLQQAHAYLDLGFKLGFGGMLTYSRSTKLRRLAKELPLDALVLETDAPDMTVASHRFQRNSPEYLPEILAALAEVRGQEPTALAAATTQNAVDVLHLERLDDT